MYVEGGIIFKCVCECVFVWFMCMCVVLYTIYITNTTGTGESAACMLVRMYFKYFMWCTW